MQGGKLVVPTRFTRSAVVDEEWSLASALWQIDFVCEQLGVPDLSGIDLLDMGCGVKMSAAVLNEHVPIGSYTGIDVFGEMVDFLQREVDDARFAYHHLDLHNELYNPDGEKLTAHTKLPVDEESFDLIWLFSVFTHLAPDDFAAMLRVLRRYVRPDGHLFFTLYINEETSGGHGFTDSMARRLRARPELMDRRRRPADEAVPPFLDVSPDHPLRVALYSRELAEELVGDSGWVPVKSLDPDLYVQHSFLCRPG
jgi:SAM-dependent methyltransferase